MTPHPLMAFLSGASLSPLQTLAADVEPKYPSLHVTVICLLIAGGCEEQSTAFIKQVGKKKIVLIQFSGHL